MIEDNKTPQRGEIYQHRNGNYYTVLMVTNTEGEPGREEKYPPMVVYQGENGKMWSGRLDDWHRRMTLVPERDHGMLEVGVPKGSLILSPLATRITCKALYHRWMEETFNTD